MTQQEVDTIFNLTIFIHQDKWFGDNKKRRDRDEVQRWVSKQLASSLGIYTTPLGMTWGHITTKEKYEDYWNEWDRIQKQKG